MNIVVENKRSLISFLALLYVLIIIITVALGPYFEANLPVGLQESYATTSEIAISDSEVFGIVLIGIASLAFMSSLIGLVFNAPWSPKPFLYSSAAMILLTPFFGAVVLHPLENALGLASCVIWGALLTLLLVETPQNRRQSPAESVD